MEPTVGGFLLTLALSSHDELWAVTQFVIHGNSMLHALMVKEGYPTLGPFSRLPHGCYPLLYSDIVLMAD
eukprot:41135-Eustigmatos_ZCMA.PRE.1